MSYWDTSALAKLYIAEPDSGAFQTYALTNSIVTSRLALWELRHVALRKEVEGVIQSSTAETIWQQAEADVINGRVSMIELDQNLTAELESVMAACYRGTPSLAVRTLDSIHLASARVAGETEIVATDARLRSAALSLGLAVFPT
ncbi:MAG: type II toxin-antitoxin system VapC family toxin [Verrucomicrobiota bacterium]